MLCTPSLHPALFEHAVSGFEARAVRQPVIPGISNRYWRGVWLDGFRGDPDLPAGGADVRGYDPDPVRHGGYDDVRGR